MFRFHRLALLVLSGGLLLSAQIPNPLNLPDPLGLSKKPAPAPREGRSTRREPRWEGRRHEGKHKGHRKHDNGKHRGEDRRSRH